MLFLAAALVMSMSACTVIDYAVRDTVHPDTGSAMLPDLTEDAAIRRDKLGIPVVEAQNRHDLSYTAGYTMAADRLAQMVSFS
ncbi:MAG: penicillin acylase family protein, partial [Desulfosalsimonadaceae bacterium]